MQGTVDHRAMIGQDFAPVRQKLRIVVQTGTVGLESRADVNVHAVRVLTPQGRSLSAGRVVWARGGLLGERRRKQREEDGNHYGTHVEQYLGSHRSHTGKASVFGSRSMPGMCSPNLDHTGTSPAITLIAPRKQ